MKEGERGNGRRQEGGESDDVGFNCATTSTMMARQGVQDKDGDARRRRREEEELQLRPWLMMKERGEGGGGKEGGEGWGIIVPGPV